MNSAEGFEAARKAYKQARWNQRKLIVAALKDAGFYVYGGGKGKPNYTSDGRLDPDHDLSNWMWVKARLCRAEVMVNLQVLDRDPNSGNIHALMDRIGLEVSLDGDEKDGEDPLCEKDTTSFKLPLSKEGVDRLVDEIKSRIKALLSRES